MQENNNSSSVSKPNKTQMQKLALPIIFVIILLFIIMIVLSSKSKPNQMTQMDNPTVPTAAISEDAQSVLTLLPNPLTLDATGKGSIDVNIETGTNSVTAVQLELQYDPAAITGITVQPGSFFSSPVELLERIDTRNGRITYMIGISPTEDPISGNGTVAVITFSKTANTKLTSTELNFSKTELSESLVAATGIDKSVLRSTNNTTINLSQ